MMISPAPSIAIQKPVHDMLGMQILSIGSDYCREPGTFGRCQILSHIQPLDVGDAVDFEQWIVGNAGRRDHGARRWNGTPVACFINDVHPVVVVKVLEKNAPLQHLLQRGSCGNHILLKSIDCELRVLLNRACRMVAYTGKEEQVAEGHYVGNWHGRPDLRYP